MKIKINNKFKEILNQQISITDLIEDKDFEPKMLVTKINGVVINSENRDNTYVNDGDEVIILKIINGG